MVVAEAMLDCFGDGLLRPGANEVAERAGASTRAVFRHFDNMEALIEQASELQIERVMSQLPPLAWSAFRLSHLGRRCEQNGLARI